MDVADFFLFIREYTPNFLLLSILQFKSLRTRRNQWRSHLTLYYGRVFGPIITNSVLAGVQEYSMFSPNLKTMSSGSTFNTYREYLYFVNSLKRPLVVARPSIKYLMPHHLIQCFPQFSR